MRQRYSDRDKAAALAALDLNEGNVWRTAKELGIPRSTLQSWANERGINADVPELRQQKKGDLAEKFEQIANAYADRLLEPEVIKEASPNAAIVVAGTATDKMRVLRGLPTEIVQILPDVLAAIETLGIKPSDVFNGIIERAAKQRQDAG